MTVAIVDTGMCNLDSIARAVEECGGTPLVTEHPEDLGRANHVILPGVGAFADAMAQLQRRNLDEAIVEQVGDGIPMLGVCLGMQLLAKIGEEGGPTEGLGLIDADVVRLTPSAGERVPHMGWNEVVPVGDDGLFEGVASGSDFYFVHSYHVRCQDEAVVAARTPYCGSIVAAVASGNIRAVQFHPEKSRRPGLRVLRNFLGS